MAEERLSPEEEKAWAEEFKSFLLGAMKKTHCDHIVMAVINKHGKPITKAILPARPESQ
jgi:hypothetical protein